MDLLVERAKKQGQVKKHSFLKPHIIQLSAHALAAVPRTIVHRLSHDSGGKLSSELFTQIVLQVLDRHYLLTWQEWRHLMPIQPVPRRRIRRTKVFLKNGLKVEFIAHVQSKSGDGGQFYGDAQDFAEGPDGKPASGNGDRLNEAAQKVETDKGSGVGRKGSRGSGSNWNQVQDVGLDTPTIIYFHGGGFCFGSVPLYRRWLWNCSRKLGGIRFLAVEYSLSPEVAFPVALKQALDAYLWLTDPKGGGVSPLNVILGGDSAGGNLVASLMMMLRQMRLEKELEVCNERQNPKKPYDCEPVENRCPHSKVKECLNVEEQVIDETSEQKEERMREEAAEDSSTDEETVEEKRLKMQLQQRRQSFVDLKQQDNNHELLPPRSPSSQDREIRRQPTLHSINFDMELVKRHRLPFELDPDQVGRYPGMPLAAYQISPWVDLSQSSSVHSPDSWGRLKFRPYNMGVRFALAYLGLEAPNPPETRTKEKLAKRRSPSRLFRRRKNSKNRGESANEAGTGIEQLLDAQERARYDVEIEFHRQDSITKLENPSANLFIDGEEIEGSESEASLPRTDSTETEIGIEEDSTAEDPSVNVDIEPALPDSSVASDAPTPLEGVQQDQSSSPRSSQGFDVHSPYISPKYGDQRGLPPLFISAGDEEPLLGDILKYYENCKQAGVEAELFMAKNANHDYQFFFAAASLSHPEIPRYWTAAREWLMRQIQRGIPRSTSSPEPQPPTNT